VEALDLDRGPARRRVGLAGRRLDADLRLAALQDRCGRNLLQLRTGAWNLLRGHAMAQRGKRQRE